MSMIVKRNPQGKYPQLHESTWGDPTAIFIGNVAIGKNVFIGPGAVIRADEPESSIVIKDNCNIQDNVIIHALGGSSVTIGNNTSLAHGCIVHGPCNISNNCFIGFGSVVFNANIEEKVVVKHLAVIEDIAIPAFKLIPSKMLVNTEDAVSCLEQVDNTTKTFSDDVIKVNLDLVKGYKNEKGVAINET